MLEDADLEKAAAEGIITSAQVIALRELAARRERERAVALGHEERFRFMRGFNDVFFAVGVLLFVGGVAFLAGGSAGGLLLTAAVAWALAELLVARMRLVLPGILLAILFVAFVCVALPAERLLGIVTTSATRSPTGLLDAMRTIPGMPLAIALRGLVAAAAAGAFYFRFQLPFALLPLAGSAVVVALAVASLLVPAQQIWDPVVLLVCGLGVFAAAMAFDTSDRERSTRRADCAFWLHLLAAPLIVHSLIWLISPALTAGSAPVRGPSWQAMTPALAAAIVLIFSVLALVAIAIDRRALLVAGLTYLGTAIGYTIGGAQAGPSAAVAVSTTLALLGALVLTLGVGWMNLRRLLMSHLSASLSNHLPPVPAHT